MRIAALVSGGVDSSVALKLLKDKGHDITAYYIKIWLEDELSFLGDCPWQEDLSYVKVVCSQLNIPLKIVSLQKEYFDMIISYTIAEVKAGRTPNPDVLCNTRIKFGAFYNHIDSSYDKIATGHYAQVFKDNNGIYKLKMSIDTFKDQTYFLSSLSQEQLSRCLFPIGHLTKLQVRKLAKEFDLPNQNRKDSQGLCFLGKIKFKDFVKAQIGTRVGQIKEYETNKILGQHEGFWFYTIGQRQGLGLAGGPWFVVKKEVKENIVFVSKNYHSQDKKRNSFLASDFNWHSQTELKNLKVKLRHGENMYNCSLDFIEKNIAKVIIDQNDQGIAPGQFAVFYKDNICIGNAIII